MKNFFHFILVIIQICLYKQRKIYNITDMQYEFIKLFNKDLNFQNYIYNDIEYKFTFEKINEKDKNGLFSTKTNDIIDESIVYYSCSYIIPLNFILTKKGKEITDPFIVDNTNEDKIIFSSQVYVTIFYKSFTISQLKDNSFILYINNLNNINDSIIIDFQNLETCNFLNELLFESIIYNIKEYLYVIFDSLFKNCVENYQKYNALYYYERIINFIINEKKNYGIFYGKNYNNSYYENAFLLEINFSSQKKTSNSSYLIYNVDLYAKYNIYIKQSDFDIKTKYTKYANYSIDQIEFCDNKNISIGNLTKGDIIDIDILDHLFQVAKMRVDF